MHTFAVVPTHTHPATLDLLLQRAGMPVVVVLTRPGLNVPGTLTVTDYGPPNIHRWWNRGIAAGLQLWPDATTAVIVNHDVVPADATQLPRLAAHLKATGATLAGVGLTDTEARGEWAPNRRLVTGWCFAMNLTHTHNGAPLRAPEQFSWWFGDDWLDAVARLSMSGVATAAIDVEHRRDQAGLFPPEFTDLVDIDRMIWQGFCARQGVAA